MHSLGGTELQVSSVILGRGRLVVGLGGSRDRLGSNHSCGGKSGITTIDTAPVYGFGRSEEVVGRGIKGFVTEYKSSRRFLRWDTEEGAHFFDTEDPEGRAWRITRNLRPDSVRWEVEQSLRRLQVDHIDWSVSLARPVYAHSRYHGGAV